jgi:hypothetical protein
MPQSKLKLHLPGAYGHPLCGRQVFNHRQTISQDQVGIEIASTEDFLAELGAPKRPRACRFCARKAGLLPPLPTRAQYAEMRAEAAAAAGEEEMEDGE